MPRDDSDAGQKTEFHKSASVLAGEVDVVEGGGIAAAEVDQGREGGFWLTVVATHLHLDLSMPESEMIVKIPPSLFEDNKMRAPHKVRRLRMADLNRIMEIERASFGDEAYDRNLFAEFFHKCAETFLVAEHNRKVRGYMIACIRGNQAELVSVAVDPAARRRGVASALMESTLRRLRRRRIARIGLVVRVTNDRARAFYERYGFEKVRKASRYYEDGADGWRMAKDLTTRGSAS
jgi:ribosomal-protein-alanine N-acetyltransferase